VFSTSPTFTTGITVPNDSISNEELSEGDNFDWTGTHTFTGSATARDHGTAAVDEIINASYGTGEPPNATSTTEGSIFIKYTP